MAFWRRVWSIAQYAGLGLVCFLLCLVLPLLAVVSEPSFANWIFALDIAVFVVIGAVALVQYLCRVGEAEQKAQALRDLDDRSRHLRLH